MVSTHPGLEEPIAVIGSACRFPGGSSSPSKLWELLQEPRDVVRNFDPKRFNLERFYHPDGETHGSTDVKPKSYLLEEDSRVFDAAFFSSSPVDAASMDPQQRQLLEVTYEAFESAGVPLEKIRGSLTSVHVGVMTNDYAVIQARDTETLPKYNATGSANSILSNRVSYVFDLKGPSVTLDTACSSSLVALHHAVQGLRNGDSELAIVGGTNLIFEPTPYIAESKLHMLSPDSQSRMWDKTANGYARGEGIAALLLKPLSRALRDGDSIEGVIRATGVNSDGQSPGITMPFAPAQAALIRQTYRRAGLDPMRDPPQYFECHGTGTQAGDPVEARAVYEAFYRDGKSGEAKVEPQTIHVGSIKTIIGHLEGCAGLAGVIKVLLCLKHKTIPPNMHFHELNPKIAQYYGPGALQIPTSPLPWPQPPAGSPMRASVNSFGFGGTNAHAIIESLPPPPPPAQVPDVPGGVVGPLLFSANSGSSLLRNVQRHLAHLQKNADIDLRDLNWVLQTRRSTHRVRAAFAGASRQDILDSMAKFVASHANAAKGEIGSVPRLVNPKEAPGTLGIFTGQGAQWAAMGRELLRKSPLFRRSLEACEAVLKNDLLPGHAPEWSLVDELVKDAPESRISEAALSQPLCTAVQIGLVDMLAACGIKLDAAVGHSSGEIAATYATGIINLKAAMQISFYRGFYAHLARGAQGQKGGMIAVGLSMEAASQFCRQPSFEGRLTVAASNGPQSCTLSGDLDAVVEAKKQLDLDNTFARQLQVDTAYHSHHMHACSDQYLQSLLACDIKVTPPKPGGCVWNSSVRGDTRLLKPSGDLTSLRGPYWVANMVQTVKFSQAVESSIWHGGPYDVAIEVGPHPALKGPTEQTLKAAYGAVPRYSGLLKRNNSDIEAFQAAVGQVWAQLGPSHVDFAGYRNSFYEESTTSPPTVPRIPKDLPPYSWDHDQVFWRESRSSMRFRTGRDRGHELLGRRVPDDNDREMRWRNVLRLGEMPWLRGHEVLQEVLLPAAAYVSIAAQAAQSLVAAGAGAGASGRPTIRQLSVEDIDILRPVVVPDKNGVETLFTVQVLTETGSDKARGVIRANFSYYVCQNESTGAMIHTCSGALAIQLGEASGTVLPPREPVPDNIVHIESQPIYDMFRGVGLNYTGAFNAITESHRCLDYAAATGVWPSKSLDAQYILHPAVLDVAFQSLFIAHTHPSSQKLKSALLPSHINRVVVDPGVAVLHDNEATACNFDAWVVSATGTKLDGDINVYDVKSGQAFVQVEGLSTRSAGGQDASTDKRVFLKTVHSHDASVGLVLPPRDPLVDARALQANVTIERLALFYMRRVLAEVRPEERNTLQPRYQQMLKAFDDHVLAVRQGNVKLLGSSGWVADDEQQEVLATLIQQHPDPDCVELKLVQAVGGALTQVVRGQMQQQEVISQDGDLLKQYSPSASVATDHAIAQLLKQITFKFPRCSILEIGAGTGSTAWSILSAVDNLYDSYTYTDASSSDFSNAAAKLSGFERIVYKKLDIEEDVHAQGFSLNSYDVIIASNVLSATHDLESTLRNTRELLRPGGYLLLSEITAHDSIISRFLSTSLSGLVPRGDDQTGRTISPGEWHRNLRRAGFSGIDTIFYDNGDETKHITSCSVSRANDDNVLRLLKPLAFFSELPAPTTPLLVIGGRCLGSSKVIDEIDEILPLTWRPQVRAVPSIDGLQDSHLTPGMDVLCLHDIDEPLFARLPMKADRLTKLQQLLISAKNLLWVTTGTPRAGMIRGISRVAAMELPHLKMQVLGLEPGLTPALGAQHCVESLLRLRHMDQLKEHDKSDLVLWAIEPESEMLASGVVRIPRVMPDTDLDQRYNAKTRTIVRTTDATNVAVRAAVANGSSRMVLQAVGTGLLDRNKSGDLVQVQAQYSLHIPCQQGQPLYLMCGQEERGGAVIAISHTNSSSLLLNPKDVAALESSFCVPGCLEALADHFLRRSLITRASATNARTLLLLDPEMELATQLEAELGDIGKTLYCVSSRPGRDIPQNWTRVHPNMSRRMAKHLVPQDIDLFADCSDPAHETPGSEQLKACLPPSCQMWRLDSELLRELLKTDAPLTIPSPSEMKSLDEISQPRCDIIAAANLPGADSFNLSRIRYITDWRQREALPLTVQPLDPLGLLRPDRTYMIVGGSGGLGLSISKWMIDHGAKHIVITSRSAKLDTGLQQHARRAGASVYAMAMDVTRRDQVIGVVNTVRRTMPPIAGVCNFSMVLHDKLFLDMTAQELNGTLDAKVVGTEILSDIFSDASESPLDFFILTSSTASTVGNIGQANYHAANLFMAAIVESRRSRGLAASVVHIGWVADTGYVTRSDRYRLLEDHFRSMRFIPLSETDVQDAFGQAIRAGKPRPHSEEEASLGSHDITMGLEPATQPMQSSQKSKALWVSNPQLMSLEPYSVLSSSEQQLPGHGSGSNVREKVYNAKTENEATAVVVAAFATKLENILQLPADSVQEDLERPIIDLGIDSLVAVEIRTWFLKELDTEVPVVKILGGDTVLQISVQATKKILADRMEAKANEPAPAAGKVTEVKKPQQLATPAPAPAPAPNPVVSRPVPAAHTPVSPALTSAGVLPNSLPSNSSYFNAKNSTRLGDMSGVSTPFSAATPLSGSRTPESTITSATGSVYGGDLSSEKSGCEEENGNGTDREIVDKKGKDAPVVVVREAPMSAAQSRIWFVSKHLEDPAAYNTAFHYRVQGPVSMARLRRALQLVVNNHDCLRTCFFSRLEDAHPMQGVMATSAFELTHIDGADDTTLQETLTRFKTRVWDLEKGETMAIAVLGRSATQNDIVLGYHHILMDGWSLALFLRDLDRAYRLQPLDNLDGVSYVDYSIHQSAEESTGVLDDHLAFWQAEFETLPETLPLLPMARGLDRSALLNSEPHKDSGSHYLDRELSPARIATQQEMCKRLRISPFHLHLALFQVLLARMANIEDVCIGVVDANRRDERFTQTVGCFVNMLPLRSSVSSRSTFAEVAVGASRKAMEVFARGGVPFDRILDQTKVPRAAGTNPLFQAAINYRAAVGGMDMWNLPLGDECRMQLSTREAKEAENPYDVSLGFIETQGGGCLVQLFCLADLYSQDASRMLLDTYLGLLDAVSRDPQVSVGDLLLHDAAQVSHALQLGKGPEMDFGWPATLSRRVQDISALYPTQKAITDASGELSYAQMAARVNQVAKEIAIAGGSGKRVAVLCEPSIDGVVSMLAVLHVGGVYVPLDTSLPTSRHEAIVRECEPAVMLCHLQTEQRVKELLQSFPAILPVRVHSLDNDHDIESVPLAAEPESPAVLLFTSGSTGTPKGIILTQANFVNHVALKTHQMGLQQECVLQQSSLGFDMSLIQIFSALANAGRLVIAQGDIRRDPVELSKLMQREGVSFTIATPTEYLVWINSAGEVLRRNDAWRFAFSGGEQIPRQLKTDMNRLGLPHLCLTNCYGPTEITAAATFQCIPLEDDTNSCLSAGGTWSQYAVGKALPNYSVCIVDAAGHPVPVGYTGEICIGGSGIALGYLNHPDQTTAKFVTDITAGRPNSRGVMYKTGDKGRLLSDGTLLCLGRLDGDTQIKLRGQRIELQEVESALIRASEGALASAVVTLRGHVLVAHATLSSADTTLDESDLARVLARTKLPQAFIPASISILDTMPTTSNGKVDRKAIAALPLPGVKDGQGVPETTEKMTVREGELRLLWERVLPTLGDKRLGPSSDFFLCGGNSLSLMKLQKAIRETTGVAVSTKQLYEATTLRAMTHCVFDRTSASGGQDEKVIDWAAEAAVPAWLQDQIRQLQSQGLFETQADSRDIPSEGEGIQVLLTGATSFLGGHLLNSLLQSPSVSKVHCIAVPGDEQAKLPQHAKVASYTGSLLSPTLGLTPAEHKTLEQNVNVVVHAGANGHCLNHFDSLRTPNLHSLHTLASLALRRSVPILFLSSSRAVLLSGNPSPRPGSLRGFSPAADGSDGYTASKWAGEVFLENLVAELRQATTASSSLTVAVHRPCTLASENAPNSDAMNGVLRYSLAMRCAPRLKRAEGYLDFGPLDVIIGQMTAAVLELALPTSELLRRRGAEIHFRHHSGGIKSPMSEFRAHLEKVYGGKFDEADMEDWLVRAGKLGLDPLITAYIEALLESGRPLISPYMGEV